ncbi:MAG: L,D-transpeptidase, partial [Candidatus Sericytochromatia bacterium]|nr:L,D-transpeptidase [Candidatus Sericytochromatia bacterium]
ENLKTVAKSKNLNLKELMKMNSLKTPYTEIGKKLVIRKYTIPGNKFDGIIINIPEEKLYYFYKGELNEAYVVSVGRPGKWQTPVGDYTLSYKDKAPVWKVPLSIQKEMAAKGHIVKTEVKAGPNNPLGNWWMGLSKNGIGIHSTNAPASIGYSITHGCVRMTPKSAAELFNKVKVNIPVRIIYQPIKINTDENKNVYLEVFKDRYRRNIASISTIKTLLKKYNIDQKTIDMKKVEKVVKLKDGNPTIISKKS